ncbi:HdeD family acid-resistance protein [Methanoregula sp.]|uniref:HdeD family acid-resistance protein n=1 Tax=Methanoregula sp. TaxID=2052170 RepID=UPI003564ECF8
METEIITKSGLLIRGVFALIIGILCFIVPVSIEGVIAYLVGIFLLIISIIMGGISLSSEHPPLHRWSAFILSIIGIIIAILIFISPVWLIVVMTFLVALWLIVTGIADVIFAAAMKGAQHRFLLWIAGVIAMIFGLLIAVVPFPTQGTLVVVILIGIFGVIYGIISIVAGLLMRKDETIIAVSV